jgi:chromosome segregation ATPase
MIPRSRNDDENERHAEKLAGPARIVRRALGHGPRPEEELERLLAERRSELEDYAARFEETALELGRREQQLHDERAALERLLRRSTTELEAREKELVQFERELDARDDRLRAAEGELARRRSELGAVELKRAALEQREQALESRESAVAEREARPAGRSTIVELYFVPGPTYLLAETQSAHLSAGAVVEVDGERYRVVRVGPSPLPGDARRCAFLGSIAPSDIH